MTILTASLGPVGLVILANPLVTTGPVVCTTTAVATTSLTTAIASALAMNIGIIVGAEEVYEDPSLSNNLAGDSLLGINAIDGVL